MFIPDIDPFESFYASLLSKYKQTEAQIAREAKADTLTQVLTRLKQPDDYWFILIDQFEELFTTSQPEKRDQFIASLVQLSKTKQRSVKIVATMRADFLDRLSPYPQLIKATDKHRPMIAEMQPDELRLAIEQPAAHHGVVFETGLVEEIIKDIQGQAGYLPLLHTIKLWDVTTRQEIATLNGHNAGVNSVSFSPDGRLLASASDDKGIKLWDVATRQEIATLKGRIIKVNSVSFSLDGRLLASASDDKSIKLWDVVKHQEIYTLNGQKSEIKSVSFSPDGRLLASGSDDGKLILWNWEILSKLTFDDLLGQGCDWIRSYLQTNPNVGDSDRHLCDGIGTGK